MFTSEREMMEYLRKRFFPTADDLDPNRKLLGLDKVRLQYPDHPEFCNQWTGRDILSEQIEEKEKWLAERRAPAEKCPRCGQFTRDGRCPQCWNTIYQENVEKWQREMQKNQGKQQ
jgi:hypothetical protein